MKLGLLLLGTMAATLVTAAIPSPEPASEPEAAACEADESRFRGGLRIPTQFASNPASASDDIEMSFEYFCACQDRAPQCGWRSSTALASMD